MACDSCGDDENAVLAVNRVYVTPKAWDAEENVDVLPDVEHWCGACRATYPHNPVDKT